MIKPWPTVASEHLADYHIFRVRKDRKISPRTGTSHDFFVTECPDWVNVVAITSDQQIVLVKQYRHGTNTIDLEIPGGVMDKSDISPVMAGIRELREETGYEGANARVIGCIRPNPAFMSNTCHTVLIEGCQLRHELDLDQGEDLVTTLRPKSEIPALLKRGEIPHSLVMVALCFYLQRTPPSHQEPL